MTEILHLGTRIISDDTLCRDCQACILACSLVHAGVCQPALARLSVSKDMARYEFRLVICQQCDDPACAAACPSDALVIDERGVAVILQDECVRCGACASACSYEAIFLNDASGDYLKCDLCGDRAGGPVCVEVCPVLALTLSAPALTEEN